MEFCYPWTKFCEVTIQMKPPCLYFHMALFVFSAFYKTKFGNSCRILQKGVFYFGGAGSKGFATLRNVSKLQFFDKIGHAKSVGFWFYSAI